MPLSFSQSNILWKEIGSDFCPRILWRRFDADWRVSDLAPIKVDWIHGTGFSEGREICGNSKGIEGILGREIGIIGP